MALRNTTTEFGSLAKWLHILGALCQHFVAKNDVLRRMTNGVKQGI